MKISWQEYEKACRDYQENWILQNKTLYDLCKKHSHHGDIQTVNAKLWLIGRTYATGIERMIPSKGGQGSSLTQLAEHIYKNRKTMDSIFKRLTPINEPLSLEKLKVIVKEHGRFVKVLSNKLSKKRSARSFASKYLHFHCPAVPLYDSLANKELRKMVRWDDRYETFEMPAGSDEEYYYFVARFWQLYQQLRGARKSASVRFVDCYLLWMASD